MIKEEFIYSMRLNIIPSIEEKRRIKSLKHLADCNVDDVMMFINANDFYFYESEDNYTKQYVKLLKKVREYALKLGLTFSLNPWQSLGHNDNDITSYINMPYAAMEDFNGLKAVSSICPLSEKWQKDITDFYSFLIRELEPMIIWIEDDFRLHNHAPLEYGGCFCKEHMKLYENYCKEKFTPKEFKVKMLKSGKENKYRKAFFFVNRKIMSDIAKKYGETALGTTSRLGIMTSDPMAYAIEGRDCTAVQNNLSQNLTSCNRIHLQSYGQVSPLSYCWAFHKVSMLSRFFIPEDTYVLPEIENFPYSLYQKSVNFTKFLILSALPMVLEGMTFDIYEYWGNGIVKEWKFCEMLKKIKPYLNKVKSLKLSYSMLSGVIVPVCEEAMLNLNLPNDSGLFL